MSPRGSDFRGGVYYWVGWDLKAVRTLGKFQATPLFVLKTLQGCNLTRARDRRRANSETCCGQQEEPAILISRLLLRMRRIYVAWNGMHITQARMHRTEFDHLRFYLLSLVI